jgi:hypothetical protein
MKILYNNLPYEQSNVIYLDAKSNEIFVIEFNWILTPFKVEY